jgi:hypothetical protein
MYPIGILTCIVGRKKLSIDFFLVPKTDFNISWTGLTKSRSLSSFEFQFSGYFSRSDLFLESNMQPQQTQQFQPQQFQQAPQQFAAQQFQPQQGGAPQYGQPQAAVQPILGQAAAPKSEIRIVASDTGTAFFVTGVHGNEDVKKVLKELGGAHNSHMGGYMFAGRHLKKVCEALGLQSNINVIDPAKLIHIEFTQTLQWPGNMADAEAMLKQCQLTKKSGGKNAWTGDLSKLRQFEQVFNITVVNK